MHAPQEYGIFFVFLSVFIYLSVTKLTATNIAYTFKVRHCKVPCKYCFVDFAENVLFESYGATCVSQLSAIKLSSRQR